LIGTYGGGTGAVGKEPELLFLYSVFHIASGAVEIPIEYTHLIRLGRKRSHDKAGVLALAEILGFSQRPSVNTTDGDCTKMHSRQGNHAGYNGQIAVDGKHGLIVHCDVVNENTDEHQFASQVNQTNEVLGRKCETAVADSGYSDVGELEKVANQNITVIVPSKRQAADETPGPFDSRNFTYDRENDCYTCPKGNVLPFKRIERQKRRKAYEAGKSTCLTCEHFGSCTTNRHHGRKVTRLLKEDRRQDFERQYALPENQGIYKLRKEKVELPFGHLKHNLGVSGFLLRGLAGVRAEFSILTSCFNITRMIRLLGTDRLVKAVQAAVIGRPSLLWRPKTEAVRPFFAETVLDFWYAGKNGSRTPLRRIA